LPATRRLTSSRDIFIWIGIPNGTFEKPYVTWPFRSAAWAISERVTAGMRAAQSRGRHLGRPGTPTRVVSEIEALATSTDLSIRAIQKNIAGRASRAVVGKITKRARAEKAAPL
jgi:hypothetical protein